MISTRGVQRPASFTWGSRVYFSTPSKSSDASSGGWHYGLFHSTPGDVAAVWVDGDEGAGDQAIVPRDQADTNGIWDDSPFFTDLPGGEPRLAGVEVIAGRIYLFYLAGGFSQLPADPQSGGDYHGVPYDGPRGVGVFEMTIDE